MILTTWFIIICLMLLVWLIYLSIHNASIIDVCWSIAIAVAGLCYSYSRLSAGFVNTPGTILWLRILLLCWALRLSSHLFIERIWQKHQDKRYAQIASTWKISQSLGFLFNFQLQGLLAMIIATPFLFIAQLQHFSVITYVFSGLIVLGIVCEFIADQQLKYFKNQCNRKLDLTNQQAHTEPESNKSVGTKPVCNVGLWRYSRHPNYFFDWLIWLCFAVIATQVSWGWIALISPALLFFLMIKITIPITEQQSLKSRGINYEHYKAQTAKFFLWWPKK